MFTFKDIGTVPANPPAGYVGLYCNGGALYWIDESGTTTSIAAGTGDLKADGTIQLTADWNAGPFKIAARQLESTVVAGTAPLIVASTDLVTNLNADKLDGADLIDEDNMVSDSDVHVPTQQSVKAYVDAAVAGGVTYLGGYDASTNTPDLDTAPSGVLKGDMYTVTVAGDFFTAAVDVGDVLIAEVDSASAEADWTIVEKNIVDELVDADFPNAGRMYADDGAGSYSTIKDRMGGSGVPTAAADNTFGWAPGSMIVDEATDSFWVCVDASTGAAVWLRPTASSEFGDAAFALSNVAATTAPTAGDDDLDGYTEGSMWIDTTNDEIYFCLDRTTGAAVWKQVGSGTGGGGLTPVFKSANYTAVANEKVFCLTATAAAAFTITLPASPSSGEAVSVWDGEDAAGDYNVTIARNGNTIGGAAEDFVLNVSGGRVDLAYDGTTWQYSYTTPGASLIQEGAFAPTLLDNTLSDGEGQTYTEQTGHYRKIGDICFFWGEIIVNSLGSLTTSENASIGGLPFTAASIGCHSPISVGVTSSLGLASSYALTGAVIDGQNYISLQQHSATTGTTAVTVAQVSAGARIVFSGSYIAA